MKKKSNAYLLSVAVLGAILACSNTACAYEAPIAGGFGGAINNHDMMMLREQQRLLNEKKDFEEFQERKEDKKKTVISGNNGEASAPKEEKLYDTETSKVLRETQQKLQEEKEKKKLFRFKKNKKKQELTESQTDEEPVDSEISQTPVDALEATVSTETAAPEKIYVKALSVSESAILSDYEIQEIADTVVDKHVTFEELAKVVENFNYLYATKGYVTAHAFLPEQTIQNDTVKITLVEGLVGNVTVSNNKYTSTNFIKKRINADSGDIFRVIELEKDIVTFNNYNPGIKLHAQLDKGEVAGTTDIHITAEEKFPFRVTALADNAGRKTIGEYRGGLMLQADSLFKQRDRLTLGSYVSRHSVTPFADYNIPVNKRDGRVGFMFSSSYAEIGKGPYEMFDISSRSYNYSLYYTHPLVRKPKFELTSYTAANYKEASTSFGDYRLNTDQITSFETSLSARYDSRRGIWYLNQGVYQAFPIFADNSKYFKYTGSLIRLHDFGHGIVGQLRGMYQFSPNDVVPYIDQIQAGGIATVRGYSEGLLIGRTGYIISAELMFPILPSTIKFNRNDEKVEVPFLGKVVKGILFADHAGIYPFKGEGPGARGYNTNDYVTSVGGGLRITFPGDVTARVYWGYPIIHNSHEMYYRNPRFSFDVSLTPDFDKILKLKRQKETL